MADKTYTGERITFMGKLRDYAAFMKLRLALSVVLSAIAGYLFAAPQVDYLQLGMLVLGGFLVTGASNGLNQVIERKQDAIMKRTMNRPIPQGRMSVAEGIVVATILGLTGIGLLWFFLNPLSGILGFMALFMYVALYTPLKKHTPWAVFVGAFPGAIPPMLGYIAYSGKFGFEPGMLFMVQFFWQFPHFWAIGWMAFDEYGKVGYNLLPSKKKDNGTAFQIMLYTLFLIIMSLMPWVFNMTGVVSAIVVMACGTGLFLTASKLKRTHDNKDARKLMFASLIYLPLVQFGYVLDKVIING